MLLAPDRQQPEQLLLRACPGVPVSPAGAPSLRLAASWMKAVLLPCLNPRFPLANLSSQVVEECPFLQRPAQRRNSTEVEVR